MHIRKWLPILFCIGAGAALAGCGFHLRRSAALPSVMQQQVYLQVSGGGEFPRSLAAALRAGGAATHGAMALKFFDQLG